MDLHYLREITRPEHEATEAAMPLLGENLTRKGYAAILRCLLPILFSWESWSAEHAPARLRGMLAARRRSHLLLADLEYFGEKDAAAGFPTPGVGSPAWGDILSDSPDRPGTTDLCDSQNTQATQDREARYLGAFYVFEGSTLGGRFLARQVEAALHLHPGQGNAYFQGHGAATGSLWKEVTAEIAAVPEASSGALISAAQRTFAAFRKALERCSESEQHATNRIGTTAMVAETRQPFEASK